MHYSRLFTVLAAIVGGMWASYAHATNYSSGYKKPALEDLFLSSSDTTLLSPEELALLVEYIPNEPDEIILDRLSCIESEIPLTFNNYVRNFIDYFTIRNRKYTRTMISRENVYFPLFEKYLSKHNMPQELKYLAIVESGLRPTAQSPVGALGLWQFMKPTGKDYGLTQTSYSDERMDPEKSTEAACRFLKQLHRSFGDWELALAAYNCGPGNVRKAIRKAGGGTKTFWEIFPYLPRETRGYVPSMTAVIYAMNYAPEHNIFSDSILYEVKTETIAINHAVDLEKLAEELHILPETLFALNPEIKGTALPDQVRNYPLRVPASRKPLLASVADLNCALAAAKPAPPTPILDKVPAENPIMMASAANSEKEANSVQATHHIVKRGENLTQIAREYNVTIAQLREWNALSSTQIKPEQKLVVHAGPASTELLASAQPAANNAKEKAESKRSKADEQIKAERYIHHVQPGDTLWNISQKYDGITVEQIKKLNKLKSNSIKPGQKLVIS